jgi:hypothetical protein
MVFPFRINFNYELLVNLLIGIVLTICWILLTQATYISRYSEPWIAFAFPLTPLLAMIMVPFYRLEIRKDMEKGFNSSKTTI